MNLEGSHLLKERNERTTVGLPILSLPRSVDEMPTCWMNLTENRCYQKLSARTNRQRAGEKESQIA